MAVDAEVLGQIAARHEVLGPHFNERQRRLALAAEARLLGHGGVRAVAQAAGVSDTLLEQFQLPHNAQVEHRRYHRRGRHPLAGTRGGVFKQKLTDPERVLAAILYQRQACTRQVLAGLFHVSPRTIGSILIDIRPLRDHAGLQPAPAAVRYRSATALRDAISGDTPT